VTSTLESKGAPGVVERTLIRPPSSFLGAIDAATRKAVIDASPVAGKYETEIDRESAAEMLAARAEAAAKEAEAQEAREEKAPEPEPEREFSNARRYDGGRNSGGSRRADRSRGGSFGEEVAKVVIKELKGTTGRRIVRGIFGTMFKGR
jgi:hypothetical protein